MADVADCGGPPDEAETVASNSFSNTSTHPGSTGSTELCDWLRTEVGALEENTDINLLNPLQPHEIFLSLSCPPYFTARLRMIDRRFGLRNPSIQLLDVRQRLSILILRRHLTMR